MTPGARLPAVTGNRVLYRDGVPVAWPIAGQRRSFEGLAPEALLAARDALLRRQVPAALQLLG